MHAEKDYLVSLSVCCAVTEARWTAAAVNIGTAQIINFNRWSCVPRLAACVPVFYPTQNVLQASALLLKSTRTQLPVPAKLHQYQRVPPCLLMRPC